MYTFIVKIISKRSAIIIWLLISIVAQSAVIGSAQESSGTSVEQYIPIVERDRVTRYKKKQQVYKVKESDIGTHSLQVQLKEKTVDGDRNYIVGDYILNVLAANNCMAPNIEIAKPVINTSLYNVFPLTAPSAFNTSFSTLVDISGKSTLISLDLINGNHIYQPAYVGLDVRIESDVRFYSSDYVSLPYELHVYRNDGDLTEDDFVYAYYMAGGEQAIISLATGRYIIAMVGDQTYSWEEIWREKAYVCTDYRCQGQEKVLLTLKGTTQQSNIRTYPVDYPFDMSLFPDYQPILVKASAPGGVNGLVLLLNEKEYVMDTDDGVYYSLDPAYLNSRKFFKDLFTIQPKPSSVKIKAQSSCGLVTEKVVPLDIVPDPNPIVSINDTRPTLTMRYGEQTHIAASVFDPGRNIKSLHAVLYPAGTEPTSEMIVASQFRDFIAGDLGETVFFDLEENAKPLSVDEFFYQMPLSVRANSAPPGNYDLRILALDTLGQGGISSEIPITFTQSEEPPFVEVLLPEARIPVGETFSIQINTENLGPLQKLEIQLTGAVTEDVLKTILLENVSTYTTRESYRISSNATIGDTVDITVTVTAVGGLASTFMGQVSVGEWGENTISITDSITNDSITTAAMSYSNLVIEESAGINHLDPSIRFNSIHIKSSGKMIVGRAWDQYNPELEEVALEQLVVRDRLQIDIGGELEVAPLQSIGKGGNRNLNPVAAHGGKAYPYYGCGECGCGGCQVHIGETESVTDSETTQNFSAYDRYWQPIYPGASAYQGDKTAEIERSEVAAGGGSLKITAPNLVLYGEITANGSGQYSNSGAGGSIWIEVTEISGEGKIKVNSSSDNNQPSAGGRIAVYYNEYQNPGVALYEGINLQAYSTEYGCNYGTALNGTAYLKQNDQSFGELILESTSFCGAFNAAGDTDGVNFEDSADQNQGIGRHIIQSVTYINNQLYRITVSGNSWAEPNNDVWEAGLIGMRVSLNADDPDAALYEILDNDSNSFVVKSAISLLGIEGSELMGVIRLDRVVITAEDEYSYGFQTIDRIYADVFDVSDFYGLENVADVQSNTVHELGNYQLLDGKVFLVGDVNASNLTFPVSSGPVQIKSVTGFTPAPGKIFDSSKNVACLEYHLGYAYNCSVVWREFVISQTTPVTLSMRMDYRFDVPVLRLFQADNFTSIGMLAYARGGYYGNPATINITLQPGRYVLAAGEWDLSTENALQGLNHGWGYYTLTMTNSVPNALVQQSITGRKYEVVSCSSGILAPSGEPCETVNYNFEVSHYGYVEVSVMPLSNNAIGISENGNIVNSIIKYVYPGSNTVSVSQSPAGAGGLFAIEFLFKPSYEPQIKILGDLTVADSIALFQPGKIEVRGNIQARSMSINNNAEVSATGKISTVTDLTVNAANVQAKNVLIGTDLRLNSSNFSVDENINVLGNFESRNSYLYSSNLIIGMNALLNESSNINVYTDMMVTGTLDVDKSILSVPGQLSVSGSTNGTNLATFNLGRASLVAYTLNSSSKATIASSLITTGAITLRNTSELNSHAVAVTNNKNFIIESNARANISDQLSVSGVLAAATGAVISTPFASAKTIQLDGSASRVKVNTNKLQAENILALLSTSVDLYKDSSGYAFNPKLDIFAPNGSFLLDADSALNFYFVSRTNVKQNFLPECSPGIYPQGSHGGKSAYGTNDCVYGRYDRALLPGSGLYNTGMSGAVQIIANSTTIDGQIRLREMYSAGGSIHIDTDQLSGSGILSVDGTSYFNTAGGRIVIKSNDASSATLATSAYGSVGGSAFAGAGTILYSDRNLNSQRLILKNNNQTAGIYSTPIRSIGRRTINYISSAGANQWTIEVLNAQWKSSNSMHDDGFIGRKVSLDAANLNSPLYTIVANTSNSLTIDTSDNLELLYSNKELIGVHRFDILTVIQGAYADFGTDRVIVNDLVNSQVEAGRIRAAPDSVLP